MTIALTLRALADPSRRRIMVLLSQGEAAVSTIATALDLSQPATSQHLKALRGAGLVRSRTRAQQRLYALEAEAVGETGAWLLQLAKAGRQPLRLAAPAADRNIPAAKAETTSGPYGAFAGPQRLRFERRFDGRAGRLWAALTDVHDLAGWLAAGDIEPWVGGRVALRFVNGAATGEVREWRQPHRLAYTWREGAHESLVAFDLAPIADGVRLTLTHEGIAPAEAADFGHGWHASLDALAALLAGAGPEAVREAWAGRAIDKARYHAACAAASSRAPDH